MKDLHNNLKGITALSPRTISSNTTTVGSIIDLKGFNSVEFFVSSGTLTDGAYAILLEESDDSGLSGSNTVADENLLGTEAAAGFALADDNLVKKVGYKGSKRYVRLSVVSTSVSSGGPMSAVAVLGHPDLAPVA